MIQFARKVRGILVQAGKLDGEQADALLAEAQREKRSITDLLHSKQIIEEAELLSLIGQAANIPPIDLTKLNVNPDVLEAVPIDVARDYHIFPLNTFASFKPYITIISSGFQIRSFIVLPTDLCDITDLIIIARTLASSLSRYSLLTRCGDQPVRLSLAIRKAIFLQCFIFIMYFFCIFQPFYLFACGILSNKCDSITVF